MPYICLYILFISFFNVCNFNTLLWHLKCRIRGKMEKSGSGEDLRTVPFTLPLLPNTHHQIVKPLSRWQLRCGKVMLFRVTLSLAQD